MGPMSPMRPMGRKRPTKAPRNPPLDPSPRKPSPMASAARCPPRPSHQPIASTRAATYPARRSRADRGAVSRRRGGEIHHVAGLVILEADVRAQARGDGQMGDAEKRGVGGHGEVTAAAKEDDAQAGIGLHGLGEMALHRDVAVGEGPVVPIQAGEDLVG